MTTPTMFTDQPLEQQPVTEEQPQQQQQHIEQLADDVPDRPAASLLEQAIDETILRQQQEIRSQEDRFVFNQRLAKMFTISGIFEGWEEKKQNLSPQQRQAQAMVKIMLGEAMGLTPTESMQSIYLVKGRPTLDAQIRAARMKRVGYYWVFRQLNEKGCVLIPCHKDNAEVEIGSGRRIRPFVNEDGSLAVVSFVEADARLAGLLPGKDDSNWKKYPVDMYFARAITRMQRRFASEVLNGANPLDRSESDVLAEDLPTARPVFVKREEGAA